MPRKKSAASKARDRKAYLKKYNARPDVKKRKAAWVKKNRKSSTKQKKSTASYKKKWVKNYRATAKRSGVKLRRTKEGGKTKWRYGTTK